MLEGGVESRSRRPASPRFYLSESSKLEVGNPNPCPLREYQPSGQPDLSLDEGQEIKKTTRRGGVYAGFCWAVVSGEGDGPSAYPRPCHQAWTVLARDRPGDPAGPQGGGELPQQVTGCTVALGWREGRFYTCQGQRGKSPRTPEMHLLPGLSSSWEAPGASSQQDPGALLSVLSCIVEARGSAAHQGTQCCGWKAVRVENTHIRVHVLTHARNRVCAHVHDCTHACTHTRAHGLQREG